MDIYYGSRWMLTGATGATGAIWTRWIDGQDGQVEPSYTLNRWT